MIRSERRQEPRLPYSRLAWVDYVIPPGRCLQLSGSAVDVSASGMAVVLPAELPGPVIGGSRVRVTLGRLRQRDTWGGQIARIQPEPDGSKRIGIHFDYHHPQLCSDFGNHASLTVELKSSGQGYSIGRA